MAGLSIFWVGIESQQRDFRQKTREKKPTEIEIKPIFGCEFNIYGNHFDKSKKKDNGYQIVLLTKNKKAITIWPK